MSSGNGESKLVKHAPQTVRPINAVAHHLVITETHRDQGLVTINSVIQNENWTQAELGEAVVEIFRKGVFHGATSVGAVVIEDIRRPVTFMDKLKALFHKG